MLGALFLVLVEGPVLRDRVGGIADFVFAWGWCEVGIVTCRESTPPEARGGMREEWRFGEGEAAYIGIRQYLQSHLLLEGFYYRAVVATPVLSSLGFVCSIWECQCRGVIDIGSCNGTPQVQAFFSILILHFFDIRDIGASQIDYSHGG